MRGRVAYREGDFVLCSSILIWYSRLARKLGPVYIHTGHMRHEAKRISLHKKGNFGIYLSIQLFSCLLYLLLQKGTETYKYLVTMNILKMISPQKSY